MVTFCISSLAWNNMNYLFQRSQHACSPSSLCLGALPAWCALLPSSKPPPLVPTHCHSPSRLHQCIETAATLASAQSPLSNSHHGCLHTHILFWGFGVFFVLFCLFRAAPTAYGSSQARGQIRAIVAGLCHSHSNARSELGRNFEMWKFAAFGKQNISACTHIILGTRLRQL